MFIGKDENGYIFVRVEDVEQKICRLLLSLGGNNQLHFFHDIEYAETDMGELIECPNESIDIVIAFNGRLYRIFFLSFNNEFKMLFFI